MTFFMKVKNGIHVLCYTLKITETELGKETGVAYGTINNRESGNSGKKSNIFKKHYLKLYLTK